MTETSRMDSFKARGTLEVDGDQYGIYRLDALSSLCDLTTVPYSIKLLLENLLRHEDGNHVKAADIETLARSRSGSRDSGASGEQEIA